MHRIALSSLLVLSTACPLDPGEDMPTTGVDDDDSGDTTGGDDASATLTSPATSMSSSSASASTSASTMSASDTDPPDTDPTTGDPTTDPTTDPGSSSSTGEPPEAIPATVYEIQQGDVDEDTFVEVSDIIVTAVRTSGFFAQEAAGGQWSGIWIYVDDGALPALGDVVTVNGWYEEFYELSQLDAAGAGDVTVTESPGEANVPAPEAIEPTDADESWEGVLVRISGDTFTVVEISDVMDVEEFRVENGSADSIWIDDFIYNTIESGDFANFDIGASFDAIQGPLNHNFDEFKIAPRTPADLSGYAEP
jgi:predicted extracellular nuclease